MFPRQPPLSNVGLLAIDSCGARSSIERGPAATFARIRSLWIRGKRPAGYTFGEKVVGARAVGDKVAVREVDDWGFEDAETVVPRPLPLELSAVEPRDAPAVVDTESVAPRAVGLWRDRTVVATAVLLVFVVEIAWISALGYGILRSAF